MRWRTGCDIRENIPEIPAEAKVRARELRPSHLSKKGRNRPRLIRVQFCPSKEQP
jgi:hypothetical protein